MNRWVHQSSAVTALLVTLVSCKGGGARLDALAQLSDSVAPGGAAVRCVPEEDPLTGGPPLQLCVHSRADTTVAVRRTSADGIVQTVGRRWRPHGPPTAEYEDVVRRIDARYGVGEKVCLEPAAPAAGTFWQTASFYVTLLTLDDSGELELTFRRGRPRYGLSCLDRR